MQNRGGRMEIVTGEEGGAIGRENKQDKNRNAGSKHRSVSVIKADTYNSVEITGSYLRSVSILGHFDSVNYF